MKTRNMMVAVVVTTGLLVTGAAAQHEEHHQDQTAPPVGQADTGKAGGMMSGNMMSGNMMSHMSQTMMGQDETGKLVDQLVKSFAAIEGEKDRSALKKKLAEHGLLLKELQTRVEAQAHMMNMMQHMMGGAMTGCEDKSGAHKN
jgi:hypothetical protein